MLSGIGWVVDFVAYNAMTLAGVGLFGANIVGAAAGMATVFVLGRLSLFRGSRVALRHATGLYAAWSLFAVLFASLLIELVGKALHSPMVQPAVSLALATLHLRMPVNLAISIIAKLVITPLTMLLNFCAMTVINGHRRPARPAPIPDEDPDSGVRPDVQLREPGGPGGRPM